MNYTTIQNAATKIVDNLKSIDGSINALQNKQDIISTSDMSMVNSHEGKLKIEEISGKCEQFTTTGKNLLNIQLGYSSTKNGVTCTVDNEGVITLNGTASELTIFYAYDALTSKAGKTYKLETIYISGSTSEKVSVANQDANNGWLGYNNDITNASVVHFCKYDMDLIMSDGRGIYVQKDTVINNLKFKLMFIQTEVDGLDDYEPYTGGIPAPNPDYPQEIKKVVVSEIKTHGKNIFNVNTIVRGIIDSVTGNLNNANSSWRTSDYIYCNEQASYCFSQSEKVYAQFVAIFYDENKTFLGDSAGKSGSDIFEWTFVTPANTAYVRLCYSVAVQGTAVDRGNLQLELGSVATPYEPYTESIIKLSEPIELYGIGDAKDTIEDGKVKRFFTKKRFTSELKILKNTGWDESSFSVEYFFSDGLIIDGYYTKANMLCTHARTDIPSDVANGSAKNAIAYGGGVNLYINFDNFTTIDELKTFLDENEVYVYYPLATPVTEPLPAVDQIALNSLSTYDTVTYLDFDSEIEPTFKAEYGVTEIGGRVLDDLMTGLNSEILAQSDVDRITALESTIVNNI